MSLKERINEDLKAAMKSRDTVRLSVLRLVRTALKNREIEQQAQLDDAAIIKLLATQVKQREEAAKMYVDGGRDELAAKEKAEIVVLSSYLPEQLSADETAALVEAAISELEASSPSDMGKVMKAVLAKAGGAADGKLVSTLVREKLKKD